jgi:hypothetical protein
MGISTNSNILSFIVFTVLGLYIIHLLFKEVPKDKTGDESEYIYFENLEKRKPNHKTTHKYFCGRQYELQLISYFTNLNYSVTDYSGIEGLNDKGVDIS